MTNQISGAACFGVNSISRYQSLEFADELIDAKNSVLVVAEADHLYCIVASNERGVKLVQYPIFPPESLEVSHIAEKDSETLLSTITYLEDNGYVFLEGTRSALTALRIHFQTPEERSAFNRELTRIQSIESVPVELSPEPTTQHAKRRSAVFWLDLHAPEEEGGNHSPATAQRGDIQPESDTQHVSPLASKSQPLSNAVRGKDHPDQSAVLTDDDTQELSMPASNFENRIRASQSSTMASKDGRNGRRATSVSLDGLKDAPAADGLAPPKASMRISHTSADSSSSDKRQSNARRSFSQQDHNLKRSSNLSSTRSTPNGRKGPSKTSLLKEVHRKKPDVVQQTDMDITQAAQKSASAPKPKALASAKSSSQISAAKKSGTGLSKPAKRLSQANTTAGTDWEQDLEPEAQFDIPTDDDSGGHDDESPPSKRRRKTTTSKTASTKASQVARSQNLQSHKFKKPTLPAKVSQPQVQKATSKQSKTKPTVENTLASNRARRATRAQVKMNLSQSSSEEEDYDQEAADTNSKSGPKTMSVQAANSRADNVSQQNGNRSGARSEQQLGSSAAAPIEFSDDSTPESYDQPPVNDEATVDPITKTSLTTTSKKTAQLDQGEVPNEEDAQDSYPMDKATIEARVAQTQTSFKTKIDATLTQPANVKKDTREKDVSQAGEIVPDDVITHPTTPFGNKAKFLDSVNEVKTKSTSKKVQQRVNKTAEDTTTNVEAEVLDNYTVPAAGKPRRHTPSAEDGLQSKTGGPHSAKRKRLTQQISGPTDQASKTSSKSRAETSPVKQDLGTRVPSKKLVQKTALVHFGLQGPVNQGVQTATPKSRISSKKPSTDPVPKAPQRSKEPRQSLPTQFGLRATIADFYRSDVVDTSIGKEGDRVPDVIAPQHAKNQLADAQLDQHKSMQGVCKPQDNNIDVLQDDEGIIVIPDEENISGNNSPARDVRPDVNERKLSEDLSKPVKPDLLRQEDDEGITFATEENPIFVDRHDQGEATAQDKATARKETTAREEANVEAGAVFEAEASVEADSDSRSSSVAPEFSLHQTMDTTHATRATVEASQSSLQDTSQVSESSSDAEVEQASEYLDSGEESSRLISPVEDTSGANGHTNMTTDVLRTSRAEQIVTGKDKTVERHRNAGPRASIGVSELVATKYPAAAQSITTDAFRPQREGIKEATGKQGISSLNYRNEPKVGVTLVGNNSSNTKPARNQEKPQDPTFRAADMPPPPKKQVLSHVVEKVRGIPTAQTVSDAVKFPSHNNRDNVPPLLRKPDPALPQRVKVWNTQERPASDGEFSPAGTPAPYYSRIEEDTVYMRGEQRYTTEDANDPTVVDPGQQHTGNTVLTRKPNVLLVDADMSSVIDEAEPRDVGPGDKAQLIDIRPFYRGIFDTLLEMTTVCTNVLRELH